METSLSESSDAHAQGKSPSMLPGSSFTISLSVCLFFKICQIFPIHASLSKGGNTHAQR